MAYQSGYQGPYQGAYHTQPNYSAFSQGNQNFWQNQQYGKGQMAMSGLQGLLGGFLGEGGLQGLQQQLGIGGGQNQYQWTQALQNSAPYQQLMQQGQMPWEQYYGKVSPQLEGLYGDVKGKAEAWLNSANPSGMTTLNAQQLQAQGVAPAQQAAQNMRRQLGTQGAKTGGMSGTAALASMAPSQMVGQATGQAAQQASIGAHQSEQARAGLNAQMKGQALDVYGAASGQQAAQLGNMYSGYAQIQQNALQGAMSALAQILGLDASQANKLTLGFDPSTGQFVPNLSMTF